PPGQVPPLATFYSISLVGQAGGLGPPLPFDLLANLNLPIFWAPVYNIDGMTQSNAPSNIYLVDDSSVTTSAAQQQSSINQLLTSLEKHSNSAKSNHKNPPPPPAPVPRPLDITNFPPGSLWLEILNVTNGAVNLNIQGTAEDQTYEILSKTSVTNS